MIFLAFEHPIAKHRFLKASKNYKSSKRYNGNHFINAKKPDDFAMARNVEKASARDIKKMGTAEPRSISVDVTSVRFNILLNIHIKIFKNMVKY